MEYPVSCFSGRGKKSFPPEGEPRKKPGGFGLNRSQPGNTLLILEASMLSSHSIKRRSPYYQAAEQAIPELTEMQSYHEKTAAARFLALCEINLH